MSIDMEPRQIEGGRGALYRHRCLDCGKIWKFPNRFMGLILMPVCWFHFYFTCPSINGINNAQ